MGMLVTHYLNRLLPKWFLESAGSLTIRTEALWKRAKNYSTNVSGIRSQVSIEPTFMAYRIWFSYLIFFLVEYSGLKKIS